MDFGFYWFIIVVCDVLNRCRSGLRQVVDSMYEAFSSIGEGGLYQNVSTSIMVLSWEILGNCRLEIWGNLLYFSGNFCRG